MKNEILGGKERVRLHHYIQSFKAGELTENEAHRIGVEWAQEVFGDKFQVLISTHTDKGHYHNHFVVCPYDDDGKLWRADKKSLNRCKAISDKIALRHHISIIERPKKTYNHKYGDYLSRQRRNSWKENLKAELDELVMRDDVRSIDDLTEKPFVHTDSVTDIFLNILLIALSIKILKCRYPKLRSMRVFRKNMRFV